MRIAVISDTHDRFPPTLVERLRGADEIWHLGDVCDPMVLTEFEQLDVPLRVVAGNCDTHPWPRALDLTREALCFHLVHIPPARAPASANVVLHGHTHVPRDETDPAGVRWMNPGCITRPKSGGHPTYAWLTLEPGKALQWRLMRV